MIHVEEGFVITNESRTKFFQIHSGFAFITKDIEDAMIFYSFDLAQKVLDDKFNRAFCDIGEVNSVVPIKITYAVGVRE